jgi:hypothetical protein
MRLTIGLAVVGYRTKQSPSFTKQEYVALIPPVTSADYERLKASIKEQRERDGRLEMEMNRKTQMTSEIPLASPDADDMRPLSADRGGIGGHKGSATSQEVAEQFGVSSSTLERVRSGNKENNGSNSGADADDLIETKPAPSLLRKIGLMKFELENATYAHCPQPR